MRGFGASLKLAFVFSFSLSIVSSRSSIFTVNSSQSIANKTTSPEKTAAELLCFLGSKEQAATITFEKAEQFKSCLRFLVPFHPKSYADSEVLGARSRNLFSSEITFTPKLKGFLRTKREENELIWWPPTPVMELARLSVDSGGDREAIYGILDPTILPIPDIEGCRKDRCQLTRTPYGRRFINEELNSYIAFLFEIIASRGPSIGFDVILSRYDLFHGHIFLAADTGRLGILFHAKEYPALEQKTFPYNMGYCQRGSNVKYDASMNLRNIVWLAPLPSRYSDDWIASGVLVALDAYPGGVIYENLVSEYVNYVRTIYEDCFGNHVADVNYLNVENVTRGNKIFIC